MPTICAVMGSRSLVSVSKAITSALLKALIHSASFSGVSTMMVSKSVLMGLFSISADVLSDASSLNKPPCTMSAWLKLLFEVLKVVSDSEPSWDGV